ncbi:MAG: DEAD/DEAH box helicase [Peptococcaceae bacterium]|jgi:SNF2 family DNA or RNA helicase|nr:DEAD/DEAH box helicase [Peptococcaceae bacterium]
MREPLPFQIEAINQLAGMRQALLAYDMGLGKTKIVLDALAAASERKALVVCKAALLSHWKQECSLEGMVPYVYHGPGREQALVDFVRAGEGILLTSFNIVGLERDLLPGRLSWLPVVVDEAHLLVNARSQMTWGIWRLKKTRVWLVTGTPIMNDVVDLFPTLSLLRLYKGRLADFREEFMYEAGTIYNEYNPDGLTLWEPQDDALERIHALLSPVMLRKTADELKPAIVKETVPVVLDGEKKSWLAEATARIAASDLEPDQRLAAITDWRLTASWPDSKDDGRFVALRTIITAAGPGRKVFVVTAFETVAERLAALLEDEGINAAVISGKVSLKKREKIIKTVATAKDTVVLIGVNQACREGLNLPFIDSLVWYDGAWNDGSRRQIEDRIRRVTSLYIQVTVYTLIGQETPEKWLVAVRRKKAAVETALYQGSRLEDVHYEQKREQARLSRYV